MSLPYDRVYNFSAGPCALPVEVLEEARDQLLNYKGAGMSVMEMSHRSAPYEQIIAEAQQDFRKLMGVPDNYKVLFLQGGATLQFSMIPMTWLRGGTADYVTTGTWGQKSQEAASLEGTAREIFSGKATKFDRVPAWDSLDYSKDAAYLHFTSNETIQGVQFQDFPNVSCPIICDMSSDILSRVVDVNRFAVVYAGAQKNMGPAGVAVVMVRDDMLAKQPEKMHPMLDYKLAADNDSMYNTPPSFTIYMCGLVYKYLLRNGGVAEMKKRNDAKAAHIYGAIDSSEGFYKGHAQKECRSPMNVTFTLKDGALTDAFVKGAVEHKLDGIKGHRSVGGIRASIYNYFPEEGCKVLAQYMADFAKKNG